MKDRRTPSSSIPDTASFHLPCTSIQSQSKSSVKVKVSSSKSTLNLCCKKMAKANITAVQPQCRMPVENISRTIFENSALTLLPIERVELSKVLKWFCNASYTKSRITFEVLCSGPRVNTSCTSCLVVIS